MTTHLSDDWTRSSYCSDGSCVEAACDTETVKVRDSKLNDTEDGSPILVFPSQAWMEFIANVTAGRLTPTG